jgi:ribosomal protein S18 acetylase RimI-like enzyme
MEVTFALQPSLDNVMLNALFAAAWPDHAESDFSRTLATCLTYLGAFTTQGELIGFVKVAWDGGVHGFLLDPTVHPAWRQRGIGRQLVCLAIDEARQRGLTWLHVDYVPELEGFYAGCGFVPTPAGLINLSFATR